MSSILDQVLPRTETRVPSVRVAVTFHPRMDDTSRKLDSLNGWMFNLSLPLTTLLYYK